MRERLKAADKNEDGKLSKDEAPERLKPHFDKIDANGDGQLEKEEFRDHFVSMMKKFHEMRQRAAEHHRRHGDKSDGKDGEKKQRSPSDRDGDRK